MPLVEQLFMVIVALGVPLLLIGALIFVLMGGIQTFGLKPLRRRFVGLNVHESRRPGDVGLVYHTYRGFFAWFVQDEHCVYAPPADAQELLGRLLRFNLTWGMLSYGMVFIPWLALGNYYVQKRSIEKQARALPAAYNLHDFI